MVRVNFLAHSFCIALSLSLAAAPSALAGPGDINSTNTSSSVSPGTYFNTPGSRTTFRNNSGLTVSGGDLVRGIEANSNGRSTGNGGTMYFRAANGVIRLDGTVDVSALKGNGGYVGNGGRVFFDAPFVYQSGNVYANGINGGLVQYNVGAATMAPGAKTTAMGFGGNGGQITINASGDVNIGSGAILDSSGKVISTYDTNVINIEGALVNNNGVVRANAIAGQDFHNAFRDGALLALNSDLSGITAPGAQVSKGGTIRLVATGANGDVVNNGTLTANGSQLAGMPGETGTTGVTGTMADGGTVIVAARRNIINNGTIRTNGGYGNNDQTLMGSHGGDGGTVALTALGNITNNGTIEANGGTVLGGSQGPHGGNGGLIAFSYNNLANRGAIQANGGNGLSGKGGNGGLVAFSGNNNPAGTGVVQVNGGVGQPNGQPGRVLVPNEKTLALNIQARNGNSGPNHKVAENIWRNEVLIHHDVVLALSGANGNGVSSELLSERLADARLRTVEHPEGNRGADALAELQQVGHLVIANANQQNLTNDLPLTPLNPSFLNLNTQTTVVNGNLTNNTTWIPGTHVVGEHFHDIYMSLGGGHLSWLANGDISNGSFLLSRGIGSGGTQNFSAANNFLNTGTIMNIAVNTHLLSGFVIDPAFSADHGGMMTFKAGNDITNEGVINHRLAFNDIHNLDSSLEWPHYLNNAQIGATLFFEAGHDFNNSGKIGVDVLNYREGALGAENPANSQGGILVVRTGNNISNTGLISTDAHSYTGSEGPRFGTLPADAVEQPSSDGDRFIFEGNDTDGIGI